MSKINDDIIQTKFSLPSLHLFPGKNNNDNAFKWLLDFSSRADANTSLIFYTALFCYALDGFPAFWWVTA